MAGFDFSRGCSNNMIAARERGMVNIGTFARRHKVSAAAAQHVMNPSEAHHTGTGRRGRSRLTYVIEGGCIPTALQLTAMREYDEKATAAKTADPRVFENCTVRWLRFRKHARTRRGSRPDEVVVHSVRVHVFDNGEISGGVPNFDNPNAVRLTNGWEKLPGLLILAPDGSLVLEKLNAAYDDANAIAARLR